MNHRSLETAITVKMVSYVLADWVKEIRGYSWVTDAPRLGTALPRPLPKSPLLILKTDLTVRV